MGMVDERHFSHRVRKVHREMRQGGIILATDTHRRSQTNKHNFHHEGHPDEIRFAVTGVNFTGQVKSMKEEKRGKRNCLLLMVIWRKREAKG